MIIKGEYNECEVYTSNIDQLTVTQLATLMNQPFVEGSSIKIMPDCHAGIGCVVGTTMTVADKVCPNLVGVDIGCSVSVHQIEKVDLKEFDEFIKANIPSGRNVRNERIPSAIEFLKEIKAPINVDLALRSPGTLGGGNHFIEIDVDDEDNYYLVIHSGSRHLGLDVCSYYQNLAYENLKAKELGGQTFKTLCQKTIDDYKASGKQNEIQSALEKLVIDYRAVELKVSKNLAYLEGESLQDYLHDIKFTQLYATFNHKVMQDTIFQKFHPVFSRDNFITRHNYIDTEHMVLRKGAVSAQLNERLIIPMNMHDGSLICVGKGNPEWNYSAPHGAGRILSRSLARKTISLDDFKKSMDGIYTSTVNESTLDEAPMVYKPMNEIMRNIKDTVDIVKVIKPIYNFKASE